ncbi:MAG: phosphatase PAP2 family protein [Burkholderiales bacterium]
MARIEVALHRIQHWDRRVCTRVAHALGGHPALGLFRAASRLGDGMFWYALMLWLLLAHGDEALLPVLHMVITGLAGTAIYKSIKRGTGRLRPCEAEPGISAAAAPLDRYSFPSGHTLHALAFSLVACAYYPAYTWLLAPFTLVVASSRIALGLHYPSDVLAGAVLGAALAGASLALL